MGKKKLLFAAYTVLIVWYTLLKREHRGTGRVFKPELFWAIRGWIVNPTVVKRKGQRAHTADSLVANIWPLHRANRS